jgi:hypothetical protein
MRKYLFAAKIDRERLNELRWFSYRYQTFKDEHNPTDVSNARMIEDCVKEVCGKDVGLYSYILEYVTRESSSFNNMQQRGMPCSNALFYHLRRRYYEILDRKKEE